MVCAEPGASSLADRRQPAETDALMSSWFPLVCAVILETATAASAWSQERSLLGPAHGMALTPPWEGMTLNERPRPIDIPLPPRNPFLGAPQAVDLTPARKRLHLTPVDTPNLNGQLPNQRTGPKHEHV